MICKSSFWRILTDVMICIGLLCSNVLALVDPIRIGNPSMAQFPDNSSYKDPVARSVWDMHYYDGRIYIGSGDLWANRGPINIWSLGPDGGFINEYTVSEEQVCTFRDYDGKLLVPGADSTESWDYGNLYVKHNDSWEKLRTIPNGVHVWDIAVFKGNLYVQIMADTGLQVLESGDMGQTWNPLIATRFNDGAFLGNIVALDDCLITKGKSSTGKSCIYVYDGDTIETMLIPSKVGRAEVASSRFVRFMDGILCTPSPVDEYMEGMIGNSVFPLFFMSGFSKDEELNVTIIDEFSSKHIRDIIVRDSTCYILMDSEDANEYIGRIYSSSDLSSWVMLAEFAVPTSLYSFELMDGAFYVGLGYGFCMDGRDTESGSIYRIDVYPDTPIVTVDGGCTTDGSQLHATWTSSDAESGVIEYQYAIGAAPGGTDVVGWTSAGNNNYVTATNLSLTQGETYYFSVKSQSESGLWSPEGYSDGITYQLPEISVVSTAMTFDAIAGVANPDDQTLSIRNSGCGILNWNISDNADWLSLSQGAGDCSDETDYVTASFDITGLGIGTYYAIITITGTGASNTPHNIPVTLNVLSVPSNSLIVEVFCPVDLGVTDPQGQTISKYESTISDAAYAEMDLNGDSELDDIVIILDPLLGEYSINVIPEQSASPTDTYTLDVSYAGESSRLADDVQIQDIPSEPYTLFPPLYQMDVGWNLISLLEQPQNTSIDSVLSSIQGEYDSIWKYDPGAGWRWYLPGVPYASNVTEMESGMGYWILVNQSCSLAVQGVQPATAIPLNVGWNLVGYSCRTYRNIEDCMSSIEGKYASVWEYSPDQGWLWYFPDAPGASNLSAMKPGRGYWIEAIADCTWDINETIP